MQTHTRSAPPGSRPTDTHRCWQAGSGTAPPRPQCAGPHDDRDDAVVHRAKHEDGHANEDCDAHRRLGRHQRRHAAQQQQVRKDAARARARTRAVSLCQEPCDLGHLRVAWARTCGPRRGARLRPSSYEQRHSMQPLSARHSASPPGLIGVAVGKQASLSVTSLSRRGAQGRSCTDATDPGCSRTDASGPQCAWARTGRRRADTLAAAG
jgi:hypothetical protein